MKPLNNKGIALVTALMMTLISLVIIMGLMTMITMNIKGNAAQKSYRNVTEASYGGSDIVMQTVIPQLYGNISTSTLATNFSLLNMNFGSSACLKQKMSMNPSKWTACAPVTLDATKNPDVTFNLAGGPGQNFTVSSKIVDTTPGVPYPVIPQSGGGGKLLGDGTTEPGSSGIGANLPHTVYRIEVSGQRSTNPSERTNLSVLYEY
jgi:hypothetical protein